MGPFGMSTRIALALALVVALALGAPRPAAAQAPAEAPAPPFGAQLFNGSFDHEAPAGYNPNYQISIGDELSLQMWGAVTLNEVLTVDAQGNVFVPQVGPVLREALHRSGLQALLRSLRSVSSGAGPRRPGGCSPSP